MLFNNRVIHLSLAAISLLAHDSAAQQCPRGAKVTTGKQCPCLSVDTGCTIIDTDSAFDDVRGESCNNLEVVRDSDGAYPKVKVQYSWEMCNKNNFDIQLKQNYAKFFDWTKKKGSKAINIESPRIPLGGTTLKAGACLNRSEAVTLDTTNRYTVASQLEGFVVDENRASGIVDPQKAYCYAFSNEAVSFKKGRCNVTTEASCLVQGTTTSCQDFINQEKRANRCTDFTASFEWKACNYQEYKMKIFRDASNVKISEKTNNGGTINTRIAKVKDSLRPSECEEFGPETKEINSCADGKLFYSINLQGSKKNGKFWYECQDFTFESLERPPARAPINASCGRGKGGNCPPSKGGNGRNTLSRKRRRATRRNL